MSSPHSSRLSRLFRRGAALLAALFVTALVPAQTTTVPVITAPVPITHTAGAQLSYEISLAAGSSAATSYAKTGGDPGLAVNSSTGLITGMPLTTGAINVSFTATNSAGTSAAATLTVTVSGQGPTTTTTGSVGVPFAFQLLGPFVATSFSATGLPPGLTVNPTTGLITGTPTTAGRYSVPILVSSPTAGSANALFTFVVSAAPVPEIFVGGPLKHIVGPVFTCQIETVPGTPAATSYAKTAGDAAFTVNATTGVITALAVFPGSYPLTVTAANAAGTSTAVTLTVNVDPPGPGSVTTATLGVPFSFLLLGPPGSTSYAATDLAPGLSLNGANGLITGTPTTAGVFRASLQAFNSGPSPATGSLTITVTAAPTVAPVVTSPPVINASTTAPFTYLIAATGTPTRYRLVNAPTFLSFNPVTGEISGRPDRAGTYSFAVSAVNVAGTGTLAITLNAGAGTAPTSAPAYLSNLSVRAVAGAGPQTLIVGFAIGGTGTTGPKNVLLRGVGPTLTAFGVTNNALADPRLDIFVPGVATAVGSNDNWDSTATPATTQTVGGAFPIGAGSRDAAILGTGIPAGTTTFHITGVGGTSGVAIAEVYDLTPAANVTAATPRLINLSGRT